MRDVLLRWVNSNEMIQRLTGNMLKAELSPEQDNCSGSLTTERLQLHNEIIRKVLLDGSCCGLAKGGAAGSLYDRRRARHS